jgi:hypothetical protein
MNENEIQQSQNLTKENSEPVNTDNSSNFQGVKGLQPQEQKNEGKSEKDPSSELIMGKFKSVDDLSKAYAELQKFQGEHSKELGELRKTSSAAEELLKNWQKLEELQNNYSGYINTYREKYNTPEYFQDESFREMYKEAFLALGDTLDTDKFIELLEKYVASRIAIDTKNKSAKQETESILDSMGYEKNQKSALSSPKKNLEEMTDKEIDEILEKLI